MSEMDRMVKVAEYADGAIAFSEGGATKAITLLVDAAAVLIAKHFDPEVARRAIPDFSGYFVDQANHILDAMRHGTTTQ